MKKTNLLRLSFALAIASASLQAQATGFACLKPFQATGTVTFPMRTSTQGIATFAVPDGYRLQIEHVSAEVRVPSSTGRASFAILTTAGGTAAWQELPILEGFTVFDRQTTGVVNLYADAGTNVSIEIARTASFLISSGSGTYTVSGCLFSRT